MNSFISSNSNMINRSSVDNSCLSSFTKQDQTYDTINIQFKVILLGDVGVGKTTIFVTTSKNTERYYHLKRNRKESAGHSRSKATV